MRNKRKIAAVFCVSVLLGLSWQVFAGGFGSSDATTKVAAGATDETSLYTYTTYTKTVDGETVTMAEITGYTGSAWNLEIPETVGNSIPVGSIAEEAFYENASVLSVVLPEGLETLGRYAFYGCENLAAVSIPSTVTSWTGETSSSFGNFCFASCTALTEVSFAEGLTSIGVKAFQDCTALNAVTIPSTLTYWGDSAFAGCTSLTEVVLPEGLAIMGPYVFSGCTALTEVTIPSTITTWKTTYYPSLNAASHVCGSFIDCTSLSEVTFTDGLATLEDAALFSGCTQLYSVTVPDGIISLDDYAFYNCGCLQEIILPDGLASIGNAAFRGCASLTSAVLPDSVETIDYYAFYECVSLQNIVLPEGMSSIQVSAFGSCSSLEGMYLLAEDTTYSYGITAVNDTMTIYCIEGSATYESVYVLLAAEGTESQLSAMPEADGVSITPYEGMYDGQAHPAVTVEGLQEGDIVSYAVTGEDGENVSVEEVPELTGVGACTLKVSVRRNQYSGVPPVQMTVKEVTAEVCKITGVIRLADTYAEEGSDYEIVIEELAGDGEVSYQYYRDETLKKLCASKPSTAGTYYVVAVLSEGECYTSARSEAAKIVIVEALDTGSEDDDESTDGSSSGSGNSSSSNSNSNSSQKVTVKKATLKSVKSKKKKTITVRWKKLSNVTGYQIQIGTNKKVTKGKKTCKVKKAKTTSKTIKKLKSKKKYYVRVRAYKTENGKTTYGKWSKVKKVKVK